MPEKLTFSLRELFNQPTPKRTRRAILRLRRFLAKKFKVKEDDVFISQKINETIFARGIKKIPRVLELQVVKEEDKVKAYMPDEKIEPKAKEKKGEEKKETKEKAPKKAKEEAEKKEELTSEEIAAEKAEEKKKLEEKREMEKAAEKSAIKRKLDK